MSFCKPAGRRSQHDQHGRACVCVCVGSVNHHLLAQYTNSMCAIILQQFDSKLVNGGVEGVVQMCQQNPVLVTMLERYMGLSLDQMQQVGC